ncbi:MAG: HAMP domain-containing protein, partial [Chloroflexi bacterium]|nr:HAMP domain-containing protein [Chloroflexota bacterium]
MAEDVPRAQAERTRRAGQAPSRGSGPSFRSRLAAALLFASVTPLVVLGGLVIFFESLLGATSADSTFSQLLLFALAVLLAFAILASFALTTELMAPLRSVAAAVDRVSKGDLSEPIRVAGDDELARLGDSHDRLAADLDRRNRELGRILAAIDEVSLRDDAAQLIDRTDRDVTSAFGLIDAVVILGDPAAVEPEEVVPGVSRPLRAVMRAGGQNLGVLIGRLPATRRWDRADQDLFELYASAMAAAIRNAQLFAQVERQNQQLRELDAAKDDFLRGVSHNLQTPLTSIRAYTEQLHGTRPDRRLGIIAEQTERLSRMVRQLLTVSRLESGALKPRSEVVSLATRVRKAWEALGADDVRFGLDDAAWGWLAVVDPDQLDQVLWALFDNAVKYGAGAPVRASIRAEAASGRIHLTIEDGGPGICPADRDRLFGRFERGGVPSPDGGSGLGLYVSRELCRAMGGDLVVDPHQPGKGAAFTLV